MRRESPARTGRVAPERGGAAATAALPGGGAILVALAVVALLRVATAFLPGAWAWGFDSFRHWPAPAFALLALAAVAGFVPATARLIERALDAWGTRWERGGWMADLLAGAAVAVPLLLLRDPVRFVGDSLLRVGLVDMDDAGAGRLMYYSFPLDEAVNRLVPRLFMGLGLPAAGGLQLTGALVGAAFTFVTLALLRALGARGAAFAAGALTALSAGTLVHFAGYDKFGPLMLGVALAMLGAVRLARRGEGIATFSLGLVIALLSHRSGFSVLPAAAWVLFQAWRRAPGTRERTGLALGAAVVLIAAGALLPRAAALVASVDAPVHLPGGAESASREATGMPLVLVRAIQLVNALSFIVPLWPAGVAAALALRGGDPAGVTAGRRFALGIPALLGFAGLFAVIAAIAPGGGWPRDWDPALATATFVSLASAGALAIVWTRQRPAARGLAPAVTLALATAIGAWGLHASATLGLRRIEALLDTPSMWSVFTRANAYDILGANRINAGDYARAARYFEGAIAAAPNPRYFHQLGLVHLTMGRLDEAERDFRGSLARKPGAADPWVGLASVALARRDSLAARAAADSALARSPSNAQALAIRRALGGR